MLRRLKNLFFRNEVGYIDAISEVSVSGWAYDKKKPNDPLEIIVHYDKRIIARSMANIFRRDLKELKLGNGRHGFQIQFKKPIKDISLLKITTLSGINLNFSNPKLLVTTPKIDFKNQWDSTYIKQHAKTVKSSTDKAKKTVLGKSVAIIGDLNIPQCKKYRVLQKVEILKSMGIHTTMSNWLDTKRAINTIQTASTVILYRVPVSDYIDNFIEEIRRLGVNIGYDIDDPIFDKEVYLDNQNLHALDKNLRDKLIENTKYYATLIRKCDFAIASTPELKVLLQKYVDPNKVYLWRNLVDSQTLNAQVYVNSTTIKEDKKSKFIIGYMSGSKAHEEDFKIVLPTLKNILRTFSNVDILIVGHALVAQELQIEFKDRIEIIEFSNYYDYIQNLNKIDLNIIPLVQDSFNQCKSAIRYYEASLLSIPTIVTKVGDFKNIITDNVTGYLVENNTANEWELKIKECIQNESIGEVGEAANNLVSNSYSVKSYNPENIEDKLFT